MEFTATLKRQDTTQLPAVNTEFRPGVAANFGAPVADQHRAMQFVAPRLLFLHRKIVTTPR